MSEDTDQQDVPQGMPGDPPAPSGLQSTGIDISAERIAKFMTDRDDRYACPICSSTDWLGMTDGTGRTAAIPWVAPSGSLELSAVRVLTMFCARCGFARMHQIDMFKRYLDGLEHE
jgi:ribosomal protein S27AE